MRKRIVVGISGASGIPLAISLLKTLSEFSEVETHLVISDAAKKTLAFETEDSLEDVETLADAVYDVNAIESAIASGTFRTAGMVIVPCSMKTVAGIAGGYSDNLLLRAADVTIKERRKLILVVRETPLSSIHLRNMLELSRMGTIILPAVLSYYNNPETIEDMEMQLVGKILDQLGIPDQKLVRWKA